MIKSNRLISLSHWIYKILPQNTRIQLIQDITELKHDKQEIFPLLF